MLNEQKIILTFYCYKYHSLQLKKKLLNHIHPVTHEVRCNKILTKSHVTHPLLGKRSYHYDPLILDTVQLNVTCILFIIEHQSCLDFQAETRIVSLTCFV